MTISINTDFQGLIKDWIDYLAHRKKYSKHTIRAYLTDLYYFLEFMHSYHNKSVTKELIKRLDIKDFRAWLAKRVSENVKSTSNSRALSVMKNFYKYANKNHNFDNEAIFSVKIAKINKPLPKALPVDSAMSATRIIESLAKKGWMGAEGSGNTYVDIWLWLANK